MPEVKRCPQGVENKARIDDLFQLVQEHKKDRTDDINELKATVKEMAKTASHIFVSVFVCTIATLINVIIVLWLK